MIDTEVAGLQVSKKRFFLAVVFERFFFFFLLTQEKKGFQRVKSLYFCVGQQNKKKLLVKKQ